MGHVKVKHVKDIVDHRVLVNAVLTVVPDVLDHVRDIVKARV